MRFAIDTNILLHAEGINGLERRRAARDVMARLPAFEGSVPVQVLGELFSVLTRKGGRTAEASSHAVTKWRDAFGVLPTTDATLTEAIELVRLHQFSTWDAIIMAAAVQADCRVLLSEDMHHGFSWRGTVVANPFATPTHAAVAELLNA